MVTSSTNPPRALGALITILGLALAVGGALDLQHGGLYFVSVGLLSAASGVLLFLGRSVALLAYALTLLAIWSWSLIDAGGRFDVLVPRVALPTLIGLFLFSSKVRSRLV